MTAREVEKNAQAGMPVPLRRNSSLRRLRSE
jgi:hypothetical protein